MFDKKGSMAVVSFAALTLLNPQLSIAAEAERDSQYTELEEIVVSARMRSESLQDVPLSETAFSAQAIEDARLNSAGDFLQLTPNVVLAVSQSAGISFMTIRGISQVRNGEPPVATVVDGVLQINSRQFTQELFDVERIEVLRGPQGALYGRNATGGAILITTKQPTNEFEGNIILGAGNGKEYSIQGAVSGSIVEDKLLFRIAAKYLDQGGYLDNIQLNKKVDALQDFTFRGLLKWQVNERTTVDFRASIGRTDAGSTNFQYQPVVFQANSCDPANIFGDFSKVNADNVVRTFCANNLGQNDRAIDELSLKVDFETDFATFTNIFSYNRVEEFIGGDQFPYTNAVNVFGLFDGTQTQYVDINAWSNEFRITSAEDQELRWMMGVYYVETNRFISTTVGTDNRQGVERIERIPLFNSAKNPTTSFLADDNDNRAWAAFGSLSYDVSDRLELALAARYDEDKRKQMVDPLSTGGVPGALNERTYSKFQPKISLKYDINDKVNVYTSWGVGFRSGQFNQNGVAAAAAGAGINGVKDVVGQEENKTFELGFKSEFFGNRLRLNGAFFRTKMKNPLFFVFIGQISAQVLANIERVTLIGGEIEATARLADGWDAYVSFGYTDSEINEYSVNPAAVGNQAPYVPKTTFNVGTQYRTSITESIGLIARVDFERRGAQFWDPENSTARSALNLLNLRLGIEDPDGVWSLIGTVNNATDVVYNSEWVGGGFAHPARPRMIHVDFRYNF